MPDMITLVKGIVTATQMTYWPGRYMYLKLCFSQRYERAPQMGMGLKVLG